MSDSNVTLREATTTDGEAILDVWSRAYADGGGHRDAADLRRLLGTPASARVFVAEAEGQVAGVLIAGYDGWRGNMYGLAVDPDFQRRGIARRLVGVGEAWLRGLGCRRITALVVREHAWATSLWQAAGYGESREVARYAKDLAP